MHHKLAILSLFLLLVSCAGKKNVVYNDTNTGVKGVREVEEVQGVQGSTPLPNQEDKSAMLLALDSLLCANDSLLSHSQLGLCIYDLTDKKYIYSYNANHRMRPASCQKILTAVTALSVHGSTYEYLPMVAKPGKGWCWDDKITRQVPWKDKRRHTIEEILDPMMKQSDNMMAESMFALVSSSQVDSVILRAGFSPSDFLIADGSGLSLYNYVSPRLLVGILALAWDNAEVFSSLYTAMPIAGVDGTLSKRMIGTKAQGNVHAKTGTVEGISSLSGYVTSSNGHTLAFSIINQGIARTAHGKGFQDKVCIILSTK